MKDLQTQNQNSSKVSKVSQRLVLSECRQSQDKLDELIAGCFALQKLYGKSSESMETVTILFHSMLAKYQSEKVIKAFQTWLEKSQEFPTPSDIIGLIKRNGKPPLLESQFIAISKKEYCDRSPEENWFLHEWQDQQNEHWEIETDPQKQADILADNMLQREENKKLVTENQRLIELLNEEKSRIHQDRAHIPMQDKIQRTAEHMRATGSSENDIADFLLTAA